MAPGGWSDDRWEQTKHFVGIQYICIHRKGEQLEGAEFQIFEKDDSHPQGKRPINRKHPAYELIKVLEKPNREDSFGDMMYRWNQQMDLTGSALTWMVPNKLGQPMELYSIPTAIAIPQPAINPEYPDGYYRIQPLYPYGPFSSYPAPSSAVGAPIPSQWMMAFRFPHPLLRYEGYSPMTAVRLHLDEVESIDRSRWYAMRRGIHPSAVLNMSEVDGSEGLSHSQAEIDRIRADFAAEQMGPENYGQLHVAFPGAALEPWGSKPIDMDYQGGWEQLVSFAMAAFGITKPAAGMVEDSSYASLFATLKQLHLLTLQPFCSRIGKKLTRFLAPFYGDNLIIEVRCSRIDDHDLQQQKLNLLMQAKAITKGQLLTELDMPLFGDERDDELAGAEEQAEQGMLGMEGNMGGIPPEGEMNPDISPMDTGPLGEGSLGPRDAKSMYDSVIEVVRGGHKTMDWITKSWYDRVREVVHNGRH
jgi:phage portal protein BeeE